MRARAIVVALLVAACAREPALASYHEQALAVTAAYAPQVDALIARGQRLAMRLAAVPATVEGQPAVATRLAADAATLASLRGTLTGLPAATADAIARRQRGPVVALLALPVARRQSPRIFGIEGSLAELTAGGPGHRAGRPASVAVHPAEAPLT